MPLAPEQINELHEVYAESHGKIRGRGHNRFSHLHGEEREEAIAEVVARAFDTYHKLFAQGREITDEIRGGIAKYAAMTVASGRTLVASSCRDVMNRGEKIGQPRDHEHASEPDVALGIDLKEWLSSLPRKLQVVATLLSEGMTEEAVGNHWKFRKVNKGVAVSRGTVCNLRRELRESWEDFNAE